MSDKEDRIARLSQRFKTHAGGRPKRDRKSRERQSLYLDANLMEQIDKTYKDIHHQLYPIAISKSAFLETLLEYSLESLDIIKLRLSETAEITEST